jgi:catechol 2,3-dioxygenase-like lactoylglutathione lyase family enzyme
MITGTHLLLYTKDAEADRAFFRDVLKFRAVDAGHGWLIFALPPAEMGVHPGDGTFTQSHAEHRIAGAVLYLMCDDLKGLVESLGARGVQCTEPVEAGWGTTATIPLPSGASIGVYQPRHPTAIG